MRATAISALCAAVLVIPAHAAPLGPNAIVPAHAAAARPNAVVPAKDSTVTMKVVTPLNEDQTGQQPNKDFGTVLRLPRGVSFRQADYGVNPKSSFDSFPLVANVAASPTTAAAPPATPLHSERDLYARDGFHKYHKWGEAAAAPPPIAHAAQPTAVANPADPPDVPKLNNAGDTTADVTKDDSSSGLPVTISDLSKTNANHLPVDVDMSHESQGAAGILAEANTNRYLASYQAHDLLDALTNKTGSNSAMASATDFNKGQADIQKANAKMGHSLGRRVLAPAHYITTSTPARRLAQFARDAVDFVRRHSLEFSTDPILPTRPDSTLNTSDPDVAREVQQKKNIGVVNIDSNQPYQPYQPPAVAAAAAPLNTTDGKVDAQKLNADDFKPQKFDAQKFDAGQFHPDGTKGKFDMDKIHPKSA